MKKEKSWSGPAQVYVYLLYTQPQAEIGKVNREVPVAPETTMHPYTLTLPEPLMADGTGRMQKGDAQETEYLMAFAARSCRNEVVVSVHASSLKSNACGERSRICSSEVRGRGSEQRGLHARPFGFATYLGTKTNTSKHVDSVSDATVSR